jgi:large subunit ribosomal protein L16
MKSGPKSSKYKKIKKGKLVLYKHNKNKLTFGNLGLKAVESGIINFKQIEAARKAITRKVKRKLKLWIKIFPDTPITKKSTGVRMGKGKGVFSHWGAKIRGGVVLFEVCGVNFKILLSALKSGGTKLPIKTKIFN